MAAGLTASAADKTLPNNTVANNAPGHTNKQVVAPNSHLTNEKTVNNSIAQIAQNAAAAKLNTAGNTSPQGPVAEGGVAGPGGADECANATPIGDGTYGFDNSAATTSAQTNTCGLIGCDLWWAYTASCDGLATATTCNNGISGLDTVLSVNADCSGTVIGCDDDGGGCPGTNCGFSGSRVVWSATAGTVYYIRVGGYNCCIGAGELTVSCTPGGGGGSCSQSGGNCTLPLNNANAYNSTTGFFVAADDFTASGSITDICWWGTEYPSPAVNDFTVTYYDSASNLPGNVICGPFSQSGGSLAVTSQLTGGVIAGIAPESEYTGSHAACAVAGDCYWIEIVNNTGGGTFWYWENAFTGNNRFAQNGAAVIGVTDLAFCLNIALGDSTACLPPVGSVCELPDENCRLPDGINAYNSTTGQFIAKDDFRFDSRGCCAGDVNGDGLVNNFDIDPFVAAVVDGTYICSADTNCDGLVNNFDIDPFVQAVVDGVCAPCSGGGGQSKVLNDLCWWGGYLPGAVPDDFIVTYYADADGDGFPEKDAPICGPFSQSGGSLAVASILTGGLIAGFVPEYEYSATHPDCVVNKDECYWLEIVNNTNGAGSWYWETTSDPEGNGRALQNQAPVPVDLAFCVDKELGSAVECAPPPPANDLCENATPITGEGTFDFNNEGAGQDGPSNCGAMGADIFYCWTATCDGTVEIATCGLTALDTVISVYDGCACYGTLLACVDDACGLQTRVQFNAVAGQQYLIQIGGFGGGQGNGQFSITCVVTGAVCTLTNCHGADQSNAYNSTIGQFVAQDDFVATGAITDVCWWGGYLPAEFPDDFSVTYYDLAGNLLCGPFSQSGGSLAVSSILTGGLIAGFVPEWEYTGSHAACTVAGDCYLIEVLQNAAGGSWYWELGTGGNGRFYQNGAPQIGDLRWCMNLAFGDDSACLPPAPPGDTCETAFAISGTGDFAFDNTGAAQNGPSNCGAMGSDIFYCWTASCTGTATVTTCGTTGLDTVIAVYDGCSCFGTLLTCVDDACGLQTTVNFSAVAGQQYLIQLGGFGGGQGSGTFNISCAGGGGCTTDDDCACATSVGVPSTTFVDTTTATIDVLAPTCGTTVTAPGRWLTFVGNGAQITVTTCNAGTTYDTKLIVYRDSCTAPVCVGGNDDGGDEACDCPNCGGSNYESRVIFASTSGTTYYVLVEGFGGSTGWRRRGRRSTTR